ncbi:MAG: Gfo/Idh/MocA family oxidoreductase [Bryobacterales bacterium]|nr:Gfo/Idh/MocA family oxidoreductase [Bryobacterales bacterium]
MDAAEAGKHIYLEKPTAQTFERARKLAARIQETGVKMQVGVQGMSDDSYEAGQK